jgi:cyclase
MDADGTTSGFDDELISLVREAVDVPVIASGGADRWTTSRRRWQAGADAVLAASVFHYGTLTIAEVKQAMAAAGITVRLP